MFKKIEKQKTPATPQDVKIHQKPLEKFYQEKKEDLRVERILLKEAMKKNSNEILSYPFERNDEEVRKRISIVQQKEQTLKFLEKERRQFKRPAPKL
jgi:hypothetical protein